MSIAPAFLSCDLNANLLPPISPI